ncbi:MAG: class I SAM-dependent methyltransferase [Planctomycetota bacterium]
MAKKSSKTSRRGRGSRFTAATADRHELYQFSVQNTEQEIEVIEEAYRQRRGLRPMSLKEDFCGTGLLCAAWVRSHPDRRATGLDLDESVLAWGYERNIEPLGEDAARVDLRRQNVLEPVAERFDVCVGMNFSYFIFRTRDALRNYFQAARASLAEDGLLFLDCYGGWESQEPMEEERKIEAGGLKHAFTYVWDQNTYNPINGAATNHIHFRFRDGTAMERAFTYEWRLWSLPEIRELLFEAGFRQVDVLFEDEDEKGEELGTHSARVEIENQPGWLCYIVAER